MASGSTEPWTAAHYDASYADCLALSENKQLQFCFVFYQMRTITRGVRPPQQKQSHYGGDVGYWDRRGRLNGVLFYTDTGYMQYFCVFVLLHGGLQSFLDNKWCDDENKDRKMGRKGS